MFVRRIGFGSELPKARPASFQPFARCAAAHAWLRRRVRPWAFPASTDGA